MFGFDLMVALSRVDCQAAFSLLPLFSFFGGDSGESVLARLGFMYLFILIFKKRFIYSLIYLFIYFWLPWVFTVVCALSLVAAGDYLQWWYICFSLQWLLLLQSMGPGPQA